MAISVVCLNVVEVCVRDLWIMPMVLHSRSDGLPHQEQIQQIFFISLILWFNSSCQEAQAQNVILALKKVRQNTVVLKYLHEKQILQL